MRVPHYYKYTSTFPVIAPHPLSCGLKSPLKLQRAPIKQIFYHKVEEGVGRRIERDSSSPHLLMNTVEVIGYCLPLGQAENMFLRK